MNETPDREPRDLQSTDGSSGSSDSSGSSERTRPTATDTVLSAVANEHRRAILDALEGASAQRLEHDALVDHVAAQVAASGEAVSDQDRQRVRVALHHTHLPKLEAAGLIDHDAGTGQVQFVGGEPERRLVALVDQYDTDGASL